MCNTLDYNLNCHSGRLGDSRNFGLLKETQTSSITAFLFINKIGWLKMAIEKSFKKD